MEEPPRFWAKPGRVKRVWLLVLLLLTAAGALTYPSETVDSGGRRWTFYAAASAAQNPPLVLLFHGAGGSGGGFLERSGWGDKARTEGFVALAPSGQCLHPDQSPDFLTNPRVWNVGPGLFAGERQQIDDHRFVLDMLTRAIELYHVDSHRIYLVGHSNGATFCFRLALALPRRWAGIGCVAGPVYPPLGKLERPVPTCCVFGEEDPLIPLGGGRVRTPWGQRDARPLGESLIGWSRGLGFDGLPVQTADDEFSRTERYGANMEVIYLKGHGHNYPSPMQPLADPSFGPVRTDVDVNDKIWQFLKTRSTP